MPDVVTHYSVDAYTEAAEDFWKRESRRAERRAKNAERTLREMRAEDGESEDLESKTPEITGTTKGEPNGSV
jgi:hypothetical protein